MRMAATRGSVKGRKSVVNQAYPLAVTTDPVHSRALSGTPPVCRLADSTGGIGIMLPQGALVIPCRPGHRAENRQVEVSELSRRLKVLVRDLDVRCWPFHS